MSDAPSEQVIFEDGDIKITNKRAVIGAKTYAMANITSVSKTREEKTSCLPIVLLVSGSLVALASLFNGPNWTFFVIGLGVAGLGFALYQEANKKIFIVRIGSASGEANALSSPDEARIQRIVDAVNEALVRSGG